MTGTITHKPDRNSTSCWSALSTSAPNLVWRMDQAKLLKQWFTPATVGKRSSEIDLRSAASSVA